MKILILGNNANSHFFAKKLLKDDRVSVVYQYPANNTLIPTTRHRALIPGQRSFELVLDLITKKEVDLIIAANLAFLMDKQFSGCIFESGIPFFGGDLRSGELEWSKISGKEFLKKYDIPTTNYKVYAKDELLESFLHISRPFVLKYERDWKHGLQTVVVTDSNVKVEYENLCTFGLKKYIKNVKDTDNSLFVVEEFVVGREYSYHIFRNSKNWVYAGSARDYKKLYENDIGENSISMGSYSPVKINEIVHEYADKIHKGLINDKFNFTGCIYLGIIDDDKNNPKVLEINSRPGDPEFQTILNTWDSSSKFLDLLLETATNKNISPITFSENSSVVIRILNEDFVNVINKLGSSDFVKKPAFPDLWPENLEIDICKPVDRKISFATISTIDSSVDNCSTKLYDFLSNKSMNDYRYRTDIGFLK